LITRAKVAVADGNRGERLAAALAGPSVIHVIFFARVVSSDDRRSGRGRRQRASLIPIAPSADLRVLKCQVGLLFAVTGPALLLLLRVAAKVGALG